jgi:hypothetical protein
MTLFIKLYLFTVLMYLLLKVVYQGSPKETRVFVAEMKAVDGLKQKTEFCTNILVYICNFKVDCV